MKGISRVAKTVTKVAEVMHWVAVGLMLAATVCSFAAPQYLDLFVGIEGKECCGAELSLYGFEVCAPIENGAVNAITFGFFGVGACAILTLMALVFHNLHGVIQRACIATPFEKENVRKLRRVGFCFMAIPVVGLVMSAVIRLAVGAEAVEIANSLDGFVTGIAVLCLTEFFARGVELENDVEGLL